MFHISLLYRYPQARDLRATPFHRVEYDLGNEIITASSGTARTAPYARSKSSTAAAQDENVI
jgi:hypothetical protein